MSHWLALPLAFFLLADADVPRVNNLRPPEKAPVFFPADEEIPLFPNAGLSSGDGQSPTKPAASLKDTPILESSKLVLIRFVSGEFAKAVKALPAGKEGFQVNVGKPVDPQMLDRAVPRTAPQSMLATTCKSPSWNSAISSSLATAAAAAAASITGAITCKSV